MGPMRETDMVLHLMEELSRRDCNGHAKVRLGLARGDPDRFQTIFSHYSRGTYFEHVDLQLDAVKPEIQCDCGYRAVVTHPKLLSHCPVCGDTPELAQGAEFDIVEPAN